MLSDARANLIFAAGARWRMRTDLGLAWACCLRRVNPLPMLPVGVLILRRWTGAKLPVPYAPPAIGMALRPATGVDAMSTVDWPDGVHWLDVQRVSLDGVPAPGLGRTAHPVVFDGGADVGALPSPPEDLYTSVGADGYLTLTWAYTPATEQVRPHHFAVYTDSGTGTLSATPHGTVAYTDWRQYYTYRVASGWAGWRWAVRAVSSTGVESLILDENTLGATYAITDTTGRTSRSVPALTVPPEVFER